MRGGFTFFTRRGFFHPSRTGGLASPSFYALCPLCLAAQAPVALVGDLYLPQSPPHQQTWVSSGGGTGAKARRSAGLSLLFDVEIHLHV